MYIQRERTEGRNYLLTMLIAWEFTLIEIKCFQSSGRCRKLCLTIFYISTTLFGIKLVRRSCSAPARRVLLSVEAVLVLELAIRHQLAGAYGNGSPFKVSRLISQSRGLRMQHVCRLSHLSVLQFDLWHLS